MDPAAPVFVPSAHRSLIEPTGDLSHSDASEAGPLVDAVQAVSPIVERMKVLSMSKPFEGRKAVPDSRFPFHRLPNELRQQIADYAFTMDQEIRVDERLHVVSGGIDLLKAEFAVVGIDRIHTNQPFFPKSLFLSKQFAREAHAAFYRQNVFVARGQWPLSYRIEYQSREAFQYHVAALVGSLPPDTRHLKFCVWRSGAAALFWIGTFGRFALERAFPRLDTLTIQSKKRWPGRFRGLGLLLWPRNRRSMSTRRAFLLAALDHAIRRAWATQGAVPLEFPKWLRISTRQSWKDPVKAGGNDPMRRSSVGKPGASNDIYMEEFWTRVLKVVNTPYRSEDEPEIPKAYREELNRELAAHSRGPSQEATTDTEYDEVYVNNMDYHSQLFDLCRLLLVAREPVGYPAIDRMWWRPCLPVYWDRRCWHFRYKDVKVSSHQDQIRKLAGFDRKEQEEQLRWVKENPHLVKQTPIPPPPGAYRDFPGYW